MHHSKAQRTIQLLNPSIHRLWTGKRELEHFAVACHCKDPWERQQNSTVHWNTTSKHGEGESRTSVPLWSWAPLDPPQQWTVVDQLAALSKTTCNLLLERSWAPPASTPVLTHNRHLTTQRNVKISQWTWVQLAAPSEHSSPFCTQQRFETHPVARALVHMTRKLKPIKESHSQFDGETESLPPGSHWSVDLVLNALTASKTTLLQGLFPDVPAKKTKSIKKVVYFTFFSPFIKSLSSWKQLLLLLTREAPSHRSRQPRVLQQSSNELTLPIFPKIVEAGTIFLEKKLEKFWKFNLLVSRSIWRNFPTIGLQFLLK